MELFHNLEQFHDAIALKGITDQRFLFGTNNENNIAAKECHQHFMKLLTVIALFLSTSLMVTAQRICGTGAYLKQYTDNNSKGKSIKKLLGREGESVLRDTLSNELINVPVVVHVLYANNTQNISDEQIKSQIESLNKDFSLQNEDRANTPAPFKNLAADIHIKFCLAQIDPAGKKTTGIIRKQTSVINFAADDKMKFSAAGGDDVWNSEIYLNIWVCGLSSRSLGYATPPGGAADRDGVVIAYDVFGTTGTLRKPFDKGRTATHEIGHWLGLNHIWGDKDCGDDGVDDTPKQKSYNFGCPAFPHLSDCSVDTNGDMFMNFMDFSDDACMNIFTIGQKQKMRSLFASGKARNSFLTSFACDSTALQGGDLPVDTIATTPANDLGSFKLYPNPVQSVMTVEYKSSTELTAKNIGIYNAYGVKIFSTVLTQPKMNIAVAQLSAGFYIIRIGEGKSAYTGKFIKQ